MKSILPKLVALVAMVSLAAVALNTHAALATAGERFRPSSPTTAGEADDVLRTPLDFERAAAENPVANAQILFSQCRFAPFAGNTGLYSPLAAGTSDAIVGDTTFAFADGTTCYNPQNESNIVVNPINPNNVLTSANEYRLDGDAVYVSMDGGQTWSNVVLPGRTSATGGSGVFARLGSCGDPVVAFGPDGTAYYAGLACNQKNAAFFSGVSVSVSHDGGQTWGKPVMVSFSDSPVILNDKEFMTVGPDGTIYLTWTRFKVAKARYFESPIVISVSKNGGQSWSSWVRVSDKTHPYNQGSMPLVAPDGTLYVAYEGSTPSSGYAGDAIIVARSTNGGKSFTNDEVARAFDDYNCYPFNEAQGRQTLSGEQFRREQILPRERLRCHFAIGLVEEDGGHDAAINHERRTRGVTPAHFRDDQRRRPLSAHRDRHGSRRRHAALYRTVSSTGCGAPRLSLRSVECRRDVRSAARSLRPAPPELPATPRLRPAMP